MEYSTLFLIHKVSVTLFLLIYLVKTILLLMDKKETLFSITKAVKVPEMIISLLFLVTGVWMLVQTGDIKTMQVIKIIAVLASIPLAVIGFKRGNKALAIISLILIIAAYGLAEMSKKKVDKKEIGSGINTDPSSEGYDVIAHGSAVYSANCVSCHGDDGKKMLNNATDLTASGLTVDEKKEVIINGRGSMPPYKTVLSAEDINAVAEYTASLKK